MAGVLPGSRGGPAAETNRKMNGPRLGRGVVAGWKRAGRRGRSAAGKNRRAGRQGQVSQSGPTAQGSSTEASHTPHVCSVDRAGAGPMQGRKCR